ncbi:adenosine kinase [Mycoemilia scoparia]|uniref:Adenosine kinase n=1 Tax=Mycoemilia scoparia TaxID=417184 RepID=A0A9W8DTQ9_9FUNG|nr:adenosine kinase [Mycoemilia scoparia]
MPPTTDRKSLQGALVGFCNPLLDISATGTEALLEKYGLDADSQILAEEKHKGIYDDLINSYNPDFLVGGAGQNTLRGAQRLLPSNSTIFFGAVGKDENAQRLKDAATRDGLRVQYMETPDVKTGVCAVCVTGHKRSLCTDLLAANTYDVSHVKQAENWKIIEDAKFYYVTGYFFTVSPETIETVAKHSLEAKKTFIINLSAPFVPEFYTENVRKTIPYVDILFGNESEAKAFSKSFGFETDNIEKIAHLIAHMPKHDTSRPRVVIITQGADSTIVATQNSDDIQTFPTNPIPSEEIADTNGAGDAFSAGFLSQFVLGRSFVDSIEAGNWLAGKVIREVGPTYPEQDLVFEPTGKLTPSVKSISA